MRSRTCVLMIVAAAVTMPGCGPAGDPGRRVRLVATVHGCDGRPPARAYARRVIHDDGAEVLAEGTGRLAFDLEASGFHWLLVGAVNHYPLEIPLLLERGGRLRIEVRLPGPGVPQDPVSIKALGTFNGFSRTEGTLPLVKQENGTWTATLRGTPAEIAYLLEGRPRRWRIAGTQTEVYRLDDTLDGRGRYLSVIRSTRGTARISFDPRRLPRCTGDFDVRFADAGGRTARLARAYLDVLRLQETYAEAVQAHEEAGGMTADFRYQGTPMSESIAARALLESDEVVRDYLELQAAGWLPAASLDEERAARLIAEVPPSAPGWSLSMSVLYRVSQRHPDRRALEEYALRAVDSHDDEAVRSSMLLYATDAAFADGRLTEAEGRFRRLLAEFPLSPEAAQARATHGADRPIQVGRPAPAFAFSALDRPGEIVTHRSFAGRPYLIDFWETSCGPCIAHLPSLRALQARHRDAGFTILSVSLDPEPEVVRRFRHRRPMPWVHAFLGGGTENPAAKPFGVDGVPTYVLVGADGTIAAEPWEMLGDGLERTVDRVLGRGW